MKILVTGAHFTPAVAVIEELKKYQDTEIVYVGRKTTLEGDKTQSVESKILPTLGVKFISIVSGRLQRDFSIYTIPSFLKIPIGIIWALYIILKEKPDVILSFGGYVGLPLVVGGWLLSVPIIIHEQSLVSGLANKMSSFFADIVAISFKETGKFFDKEKTILTGNPIRRNILDAKSIKLTHLKDVQILITGGNQGSHVINLAIENCLNRLTKFTKVIHITGDNKFRDFDRLQKLQNEKYLVKKWIDKDWASVLSKVDLVISRAGINTLTEITYLGKPALLIPIPYPGEQSKNAEFFEKLGFVKILPQSKLSGETLLKTIKVLLNDLNNLSKSAKNAKKIIIPNAAKRLALETMLLGKK